MIIACNHPANQINDSRPDHIDKIASADFIVDPKDSVAQFLIASCINDFYQYGQDIPVNFRNSFIGYSPIPQEYGTISYLSGEFQSKTNPEWMPFITIKTIDYEQWIGAQANVFRNDTNIIWDKQTDFSPYLRSKMDSLQLK